MPGPGTARCARTGGSTRADGSSWRSPTAAARHAQAPATPSVTAHGGRGLSIIDALADDWGVRDDVPGEVTVWVVVHADVHDPDAGTPLESFATRVTTPAPVAALAELGFTDAFESLD